jgi:transcriptional regulator with GAF, ATPase, and Fis domain
MGPRSDKSFIAVNCAAIPHDLVESELFGAEKGAYTGAIASRAGRFERASGGTLFLDEIGDLPLSAQAKLLRVLQEGEIERLGGTEEVQADIRVVAATNQDLNRMVAEGRFREDLYYRINVIQLHLPPLRDRREDVPLLADHFLAKYAAGADKDVRGIAQEAQALLAAYAWPGNVRELENVIERAVALEQTPLVLAESLPAQVRATDGPGRSAEHRGTGGPSPGAAAPVSGPGALPELTEGFDLEAMSDDFYRHYIALALERAGGVQTRAAEMLGMSFRSFRYYAKKFNLR